jgi:hypothetical protein
MAWSVLVFILLPAIIQCVVILIIEVIVLITRLAGLSHAGLSSSPVHHIGVVWCTEII